MSIHIRFYKHVLLLVTLLPVFTACAQFEVTERSVSFNKAVEDAHNKLLLLNAVRASKRYPMHFSGISVVRGAAPVTGSASLRVPFGGGGDDLFVFTPNLSGSSGTSFEQPTLDTQEFYRGILSSVPPETLKLYRDLGWPDELVDTLFISQIKIPGDMHRRIDQSVMRYCDKKNMSNLLDPDEALCTRIDAGVKECEPSSSKKPQIIYFNAGRTKCGLGKFQTFLRKLRLLDVQLKSVSIEQGTKVKSNTTETISAKEGKTQVTSTEVVFKEVSNIVLAFPKTLPIRGDKTFPLDIPGTITTESEQRDEAKGYLQLRSPQGMIFFLGELLAGQTFLNKRYTPKVMIGRERELVDLFTVKAAKDTVGPSAGNAAVSVTHEGTTYFIPKPDFGAKEEARSLQTFALVIQVLGQQKSRKDLPSATAVTIVGGS